MGIDGSLSSGPDDGLLTRFVQMALAGQAQQTDVTALRRSEVLRAERLSILPKLGKRIKLTAIDCSQWSITFVPLPPDLFLTPHTVR